MLPSVWRKKKSSPVTTVKTSQKKRFRYRYQLLITDVSEISTEYI